MPWTNATFNPETIVWLVTPAGGGSATGQLKVYLAGVFTKKPVKVWTGSAWVEKPVKFWSGSAWVETT